MAFSLHIATLALISTTTAFATASSSSNKNFMLYADVSAVDCVILRDVQNNINGESCDDASLERGGLGINIEAGDSTARLNIELGAHGLISVDTGVLEQQEKDGTISRRTIAGVGNEAAILASSSQKISLSDKFPTTYITARKMLGNDRFSMIFACVTDSRNGADECVK